MVPLQQETNIEVLRAYSIFATDEIEKLRQKINKLESKQIDSEWLSKDLRDQLSRLQKKFYGFGREGLPKPDDQRPVGHPKEQLKLHSERRHDEVEKEDKKSVCKETTVSPKVIDHTMNKEDLEIESKLRALERGGADAWYQPKNFYQDTVEITIMERVYTKVVHRQHKYKLKDEYNNTEKEVIITAPGPAKLKPGCQYSIDFALAVVSDKYEYHLPLERQRRKMEAAGLDVDVKTLYNLAQSVAEHHEDVREKIRKDIINDFCAPHLDETPWIILGDKKKGQMWVMSNRIGAYYQFEPTRQGAIAAEMLKGHTGAVISDGYGGYNRLEKVDGMRKGLCWAHVRREFYERINDFKICEEFVRMVDELFAIESKAKTFDELRELRRAESKDLIKRMQVWLMDTSQKYLPNDGIQGAINYCFNNWAGLTTFLTDLSLPLSNNDAERALRHAVVGRKNFTGSKTINGADVAATLYTVIESAKRAGLQPTEYMKYVITERWHGREPKSPSDLSVEKFGLNKRVQFPSKNTWSI